MTIGERIKEVRNDNNLSMAAFAERVGSTSGAISMWEHDQRNISSSSIKLLCSEFKINEEWLKYGIGSKEASDSESRFSALARQLDLSKEEYDAQTKDMAADLMEIWIGLDSAHKKILLDVAEKIKEQIKKD